MCKRGQKEKQEHVRAAPIERACHVGAAAPEGGSRRHRIKDKVRPRRCGWREGPHRDHGQSRNLNDPDIYMKSTW